MLATTSYRGGKGRCTTGLELRADAFALNQNTNQQIMGDYLSWFIALNLLRGQGK